jgi:hypothetical protein
LITPSWCWFALVRAGHLRWAATVEMAPLFNALSVERMVATERHVRIFVQHLTLADAANRGACDRACVRACPQAENHGEVDHPEESPPPQNDDADARRERIRLNRSRAEERRNARRREASPEVAATGAAAPEVAAPEVAASGVAAPGVAAPGAALPGAAAQVGAVPEDALEAELGRILLEEQQQQEQSE